MKAFKAAVGVAFYLFLFIIVPRMLAEKVPGDSLGPLGSTETIIGYSTVIGLVLASVYAAKTLTPKHSAINLAACMLSDMVGFYIFLFFVGFGEPWSFGRVEKAIPLNAIAAAGEVVSEATITFDFRFFVELLAVVLAMKLVVRLLEFYLERVEENRRRVERKQPDADFYSTGS